MGCCGSTNNIPNPDAVDETHFEIIRVCGKGGFGKVNAVRSKETGKLHALKRMNKRRILEEENVDVVWIERKVLKTVNNPFLLNLIHAFQDDEELFFVLPFMPGGDMRYYLEHTKGDIALPDIKIWSAEIALGLQHLHKYNFLYRDIKPENILFDMKGHIRVIDYGLVEELEKKKEYYTRGFAGTRGYTPPEMDIGKYSFPVDFWSFGALLYELVHKRRPFDRDDPVCDISEVNFDHKCPKELKDLIVQLLQVDVKKRLSDWEDVKKHEYFKDFDFETLENDRYSMPVQPTYKPQEDVAYIDPKYDIEDLLLPSEKKTHDLSTEDEKQFKDFKYNTEVKNSAVVDLSWDEEDEKVKKEKEEGKLEEGE